MTDGGAEHQPPIVELHTIGDGKDLARTLARVLVRREMIFAKAIPDATRCENARAAS